jgi:hypothetical protein
MTTTTIIQYVDEHILEEYKCPICISVFKGTVVRTQCNHKYCDECIKNYIELKSTTDQIECPMCRTYISRDLRDITIDVETTTFLDNALVKCPLSECNMTFPRKDLHNHMQFCTYVITQCKTCQLTLPLDKLAEHTNNCSKGLVNCDKCAGIYRRSDMDKHIQYNCGSTPIMCTFPDCKHITTRRLMNLHQQLCMFRIIKCTFCYMLYCQKDAKKHTYNCMNRSITCKFCKQYVRISDLPSHNKICINQSCSWCNKCFECIPNNAMNAHNQTCMFRIVECIYCKEKYRNCDFNVHRQLCNPNLDLFLPERNPILNNNSASISTLATTISNNDVILPMIDDFNRPREWREYTFHLDPISTGSILGSIDYGALAELANTNDSLI